LQIELCPFGYNYIRVSRRATAVGVVVRDFFPASEARNRQLKRHREQLLSSGALVKAAEVLKTSLQTFPALIENERRRLLDDYIRSEQFKDDFLIRVKSDIQRGLSFVHDYKQINTQISTNINVIIETRYSGPHFEQKLTQATHEEKSIYEASKWLEEKLAITKFLLHPEWLDRPQDCEPFRFHGLVHKYLKIYRSRFARKDVSVTNAGESYKHLLANGAAVAVIPHTLIDNAAKYSPRGGKVEVTTHDHDVGIFFSVSSYGPKILSEERAAIFQAFKRGKHAEEVEEEGAGFGLYLAQLVAQKHLGCELTVSQGTQEFRVGYFWTTFAVHLPLRARVVPPS